MKKKSIAILPLRKGSKSIVGKNKKKMLGRPLYQWVLGEALQSKLDHIYVFTDDNEIIDVIQKVYGWTDKIIPVLRSQESATDNASTEFGMWELAEKIDFQFDIYCLLQATSPLTSSQDINNVIEKLEFENFDSALTVVKFKRFFWTKSGESINYNYSERPRRQDFEGNLVENGAVYAIKRANYLNSKLRLGGRIGIVEMGEETLTEIDEPKDWLITEKLLESRLSIHKKELNKIKAIVLDVDGVLTPGTVDVSDQGELSKTFSLRDGMGLELARENGLEVIIMTSEDSAIVDQRVEKLRIKHYYKYAKDKFSLLDKVCLDLNITRGEIAYIGDDVNDLANILGVTLGMVPSNGIDLVKQQADLVLHSKGGDQAVREGIQFVLKLNSRSTIN